MLNVEIVSLGDYCVIESGFAFKSAKFTDAPDDICLVKGSNLGHLNIDWVTGPKWPADDYEKLKRYELIEDDVVIAMDRPIVGGNLKFAWIQKTDPKALLVQRVARLRGRNGLDQKYLKCVIADPSFQSYIDTITTGVNVPHISGPDMRRYKFPLPPLSTQQKIDRILSAYDELIENNLKRIKLLEEMAQITYEDWFVRMKFPEYERAVIDPETGLPKGWVKKKLDEVFDFSNGHAFYTKGYSEEGYDVIDLGNVSISSDLLITGKEKKISSELYRQSEKFHLNKYDVVIAMTDMTKELGILAKSAIIDRNNKYVLNQRVGRVRPKGHSFDFSFIYATLNDPRFIGTMHSLSKGAVQFYFNTKDIVDYEITLPPEDVINKFQCSYKPYLKTRLSLKKQNQLLKEARDILLPRLMTGMIDVESLSLPKSESLTEKSQAEEDSPIASEFNVDDFVND